MTKKLSLSIINYVSIYCTMSNNENRGLASADEKTRKRVASEGGKAEHDERGLEAADEETRERVAREGGKASHGGGRKQD
jgi:general stress protein YciG